MAFAHGSKGQVKIIGITAPATTSTGTIVLCVKKWEADLQKTEHDTSSTCNADWQQFQIGKKVVSFTIDAELDLTNNPLGSTLKIASSDYASVQLFTDSGTTAAFDMPTTVITSLKITNDQGDVISYTITGKSSGTVVMGAGAGTSSSS